MKHQWESIKELTWFSWKKVKPYNTLQHQWFSRTLHSFQTINQSDQKFSSNLLLFLNNKLEISISLSPPPPPANENFHFFKWTHLLSLENHSRLLNFLCVKILSLSLNFHLLLLRVSAPVSLINSNVYDFLIFFFKYTFFQIFYLFSMLLKYYFFIIFLIFILYFLTFQQ